MSTSKFDETHNLVAFLEKPEESNGFEGIIDFLNANTSLVDKKKVIITEKSVRSDLMLEDAEGTECLPNDVIFEQLTLMGYENLTQKLTFYKAYFSSQWKFLIHTILQCLSAKTTAWNEFSSTMASAIICLATNQKFNFSKYIFDNMMKNLEGGVKFLMYPRFVQVFLDKQVEGMSKHKGIYVTPSHTKKIFANMKREGKGFSGRITPLFQTMMVQAPEDMGEDSAAPTDSHSTPIITQPSSSKPQKKKSRRKQRKDSGPTEPIPDEATNEEPISTPSCDPPQSDKKKVIITEKSVRSDLMLEDAEGTESSEDMGEDLAAPTNSYSTPIITQPSSSKPQNKKSRRKQRKYSGPTEPIPDEATTEEPISTPSCDPPQSGKDRLQLTILMSLCTKLQKQVIDLEEAKTAQAKEIASLKKRGRKIAYLDDDAEVTLIDETQERNDEDLMFDTDVINGDEVFEEPIVNAAKTTSSSLVSAADPVSTTGEVVTTASATTTIDELTLAQTLIEIKTAKSKVVTTAATTITTAVANTRPKAKGIVFNDQEEQAPAFTPIVSSSQASQLPQSKDKGRQKMNKQSWKECKKERVAQEEASRAAIIKELDSIQAMIEANEQLAGRLQIEE
ncbi:hypothetical protein Tco_0002426 [Tanacetum coccineum]